MRHFILAATVLLTTFTIQADEKPVLGISEDSSGQIVLSWVSTNPDGSWTSKPVTEFHYITLRGGPVGPIPPTDPDNPDPDNPPTTELESLTADTKAIAEEMDNPQSAAGIKALLGKTRQAVESASDPDLSKMGEGIRAAISLGAGVEDSGWDKLTDRVDRSISILNSLNMLETKEDWIELIKAIEAGLNQSMSAAQVAELNEAFILRLIELFLPIILRILGIG